MKSSNHKPFLPTRDAFFDRLAASPVGKDARAATAHWSFDEARDVAQRRVNAKAWRTVAAADAMLDFLGIV